MKRRLKGLLSVLLTLMLLVNTFVIAVSAENSALPSDSSEQNISNSEGPGEEVIPEPTVEEELVSERTETSKSFLMSDKSIRYAQYSDVIHYQDGEELKEIDNTLIPEEKQGEEDFNGYVNKDNAVKFKFAESLSEEKLFRISKEGYQISWRIPSKQQPQTQQVLIANPEEKTLSRNTQSRMRTFSEDPEEIIEMVAEENREKMGVTTTAAGIRYTEAYPDTDLEYTLTGQSVKENIVVRTPQQSYRYEFLLEHENLTAILLPEGNIQFTDQTSGEFVFEIPVPYMEDSKHIASDNVQYELTPMEGNNSRITIVADPLWCNDPEREFPIIIDPIVRTIQSRQEVQSTFAASNVNYQTSPRVVEAYVKVGRESNYGICRGFVYANLPALNRGDVVVDAKLYLAQNSEGSKYFYSPSVPDLQVNAYLITQAWNENSLQWQNQPAIHQSNEILDFQFITRQAGWRQWNITKAVQGWYNGVANHGIALRMPDENTASNYYNNFGYAEYISDSRIWEDQGLTAYYPFFEITYRNNKGLEDYWTYQTASAGRAGVGYVNDYSGNLVFTHGDAATTGSRMPAEISHVFNGYMANAVYSKVGPKVGPGWKLNVQQTIRSSADYGLSGASKDLFPYVYEDADGTEHYFYKDGARMIDEDGLGYTLTLSGGVFRMTDEKGGVMTFNLTGNLTSITDANGNTLTVNYSGNQITGVTDGVGRSILFTVDGNGYLQKITDPSGRSLTYGYTNVVVGSTTYTRLTSIQYPDGLTSTYAYDNDGALTTAYEYSGYGLQYDYTVLGRGKRVSQVWEKTGMNGTPANGQRMTLDYTKNQRRNKRFLWEKFDPLFNYGRAVYWR